MADGRWLNAKTGRYYETAVQAQQARDQAYWRGSRRRNVSEKGGAIVTGVHRIKR